MNSRNRTIRKAIVLSSTPFKEDSAMVTLAGENGIFSCLAKGIFKPKSNLKSLLITGNILEVDSSELNDGFCYAYGTKTLFDASLLLKDIRTSSFLLFFQEICLSLFHFGDSFPFDDVRQILSSMSEDGDVLSLCLLFLGRIYHSLGLSMNVHNCIRCGNQVDIVSYSLKDGGFICKNCLHENEIKVDDVDLYVLKFSFMELNPGILSKKVPFENGNRVFVKLYENIMDYFDIPHLRSFPFLIKTISDDL